MERDWELVRKILSKLQNKSSTLDHLKAEELKDYDYITVMKKCIS